MRMVNRIVVSIALLTAAAHAQPTPPPLPTPDPTSDPSAPVGASSTFARQRGIGAGPAMTSPAMV